MNPPIEPGHIAEYVALREAAHALSKAADDLEREVSSRATNEVTLGELRAIKAALAHVGEVGERLLETLA